MTGPGELRGYNDLLQCGRYGDIIPVGARFFASMQSGLEAHPDSCRTGIVSFPVQKRPGCGIDHPHDLTPKLRKSRAIIVIPSRSSRQVIG